KKPAGFAAIPRAMPSRAALLRPGDRDALEAPVADVPDGFDFRYFQPAPPDQCTAYLRGDEWLVLDGLHPSLPRLQTRLPSATGQARWAVGTAQAPGPLHPIELVADLLVLDVDRQLGSVVWRGSFAAPHPDLLAELVVFAGVELP